MLPIILLLIAIPATFANKCDCPEGYQKGETAGSCRILLERLPCNTTLPICQCPDGHTVTLSRQFGYVCKKEGSETQCINKKDFDNFMAQIVDPATWSMPAERCICAENFKVSKNWDTILCVHPRSYWKEIPCGLSAPPVCKCRTGQIYGISEDNKKVAYNSLYGCRTGEKGKVESCSNENEIKEYFDAVLKTLESQGFK